LIHTKIFNSEILLKAFLASARPSMMEIRQEVYVESKRTYVTITTPLLLAQEKITWFGVAPKRSAAALTTASTGPPGLRVIELFMQISAWFGATNS
jgi:hypothetical protein